MDSAMCQIFLQVRNMWSLLNLGTSKGVILSREASDKKQVHEMGDAFSLKKVFSSDS